MRGPLQFDGKEIERWADDPSAAYELPRLVRRLLRASTKLRALEMGAGSAGNLGGWDGLCEAREPSTFCPGGRSGWELSTEKGVKKKLDGDFEKRVKDPAPLDGAASYVAVTARRWTKKQNWVSARTREGHWNEVRLLDADDLAHWLEECPAVAAWFASTQLGRPSETFVTLDRGLERWSRATAPWLPPRLLLAGRETQAAAIAEWSQRSTPSWLRVVGPTRGEAAMFVAAALQQLGEDVADRALLVDTATGWRWIVQQTTDQPLILVPNFDEFEPDLGTGMHWVVQTLDPNANIHNLRDVVRIDEPQPWHAFGRELRKLGLSETDAVIQSEQSRGRLQELRRNLGLVENSLPDWARRADREALLAMLLIGAWNPKHDGDRSTIEKLGVQAERLERLCADLMTSPEAPILRRDGAYEWGSAVGAWKRLADWVTDGDHTQLQVIAQDVLGEDDPSYELPADSRFMASISGKSLTRSEALRSGVANSLLQASRTSPRGRDVAIAVVRACLSTNWRHWASLRDLLPTLAEAAPDSFLDCVEASLNAPEGVIELFAQEGPPALGGSTPHVGLLWALELLAWEPQRMRRATDALARLAYADPARSDPTTPRVGNRPLPSLAAVFHLVTPQTLADDNDRHRTLDALTRQYPEVGFELLMSLLDACRGPSILPQSNRPAHDNRVPVSPDTPAENTVDTRKRKYLDLVRTRSLHDESTSHRCCSRRSA